MTNINVPVSVPYGLGLLPQGMPHDDPRLPVVKLDLKPLCLNTESIPTTAVTGDLSNHESRLEMMVAWLKSGCSNYAPRSIAFIDAYIGFISSKIEHERNSLQARLVPYGTLYSFKDWIWSALRPVPRAWIQKEARYEMTDYIFWDGLTLTEFVLNVRDAPNSVSDEELRDPEALFTKRLPRYDVGWLTEIIPRSPFRQKLSNSGQLKHFKSRVLLTYKIKNFDGFNCFFFGRHALNFAQIRGGVGGGH